jgi:hypothetical protein
MAARGSIMIALFPKSRALSPPRQLVGFILFHPLRHPLLWMLLVASGCQPGSRPSESTESQAVQPEEVASSNDLNSKAPEQTGSERETSTSTVGAVLPSTVTTSWGRKFFTDSEHFQNAPKIRELRLPVSDGDEAIWGALGRDSKGSMYFGLASKASKELSAGLLQFSPQTGKVKLLGRVDDEISEGEPQGQVSLQDKIHSKLYEASDGQLYFASLDETGETEDGSANGQAGGHLIRINPSTGKWKSVLHTPESLISIGCSGRYIYALGYFGSRIYQFDTETQASNSVPIANYGGHLSRNLLVTTSGHVLSIRVTSTAPDDASPGTNWTTPVAQDDARDQFQFTEDGTPRRRVLVELVELNTDLKEVHAWPLPGYEAHGTTSSHGITSFASLRDGSLLFTTQNGLLWHIHASDGKPDRLESLGWIHPEGESACTAMFAPTGNDYLIAVTKLGRRFDLLVYYLKLRESVTMALDPSSTRLLQNPLNLVYGSETMDDYGNAYLAGWKRMPGGYVPLVLQLRWR